MPSTPDGLMQQPKVL